MTRTDTGNSMFMRNGRQLTDAQMSRRAMMQRLALTGGGAALAAALPGIVGAQATPDASPVASPIASPVAAAPYDGPLAAEQVLRLPTGEPPTLDPGVSFGDVELAIFFNTFDGLTGIDQQTGEVVGRVAERWEENEDASVFTFYLKPEATWSDGTPLTANDFVYSWQRVLDPNTLSEYMSALYPVLNGEAISNQELPLTDLGVAALDDYTLEVTLEGPTTFFPRLTATWTYFPVPKHIIDEFAEGWTDTGAPGVSNGPFIVESWAHDQQIVLVPNPSYTTGDPVTLTRAEYRLFQDASTQAFIAYEADEIDYAAPEGPDLERALADPAIADQVIEFPLSNCNFLVPDCRVAPTDQIAFRQAIYKAINRDELANTVLLGQWLPAYTIVSPDIPGSLLDQSPLTESAGEAAQLLVDAGIDPASVTLDITYQSEPARLKTICEYLQATFQDALGITVTLTPIEDATYTDWRASRETQNFGIYTGSWGSDFVDPSNWHNQNFTSSANHYRNFFTNADYDELCAAAVVNTNTEERNTQYQEAERILVEEAGIIPLYRGKALRVVKPYVRDVYFQSLLSVVHLRTIKIAAV